MTLEEKLAQLGSHWVFELADDDGLTPESAGLLGLGSRPGDAHRGRERPTSDRGGRSSRTTSSGTSSSETRLGIPAIVHEEICSGLMARDATVFPQAIGLASTWEPALVEELADAVRTQMRATGAHQGLGPVLDVCRDPRWGRLEETFGEDPHLVASMGVAFVRGLQGDDLREGVVATAKHLVGYGASEGAKNWAPAQIPTRELHDVYLHPFEAAVRAGVRSVMNAYNEVDGVPCAADRELLTTLLRDTWGFEGCVVSDYFSVRQLADYHRFALDAARCRRADPRGRAGRRAPEHRLLRRAAPRRGSRRRRRRGDDRHGRPAGAPDEVRARALREAVRQLAGGSGDEQHAPPTRARADARPQEPRAPPERRHPPAPARRRLGRRDRPVRRRGQESLRRLRLPRPRRVAARVLLDSGDPFGHGPSDGSARRSARRRGPHACSPRCASGSASA